MTTIGLSYSLVKISTKCAPALGFTQAPAGLKQHGPEGDFLGLADGFQRVVWVCLIVVHGLRDPLIFRDSNNSKCAGI